MKRGLLISFEGGEGSGKSTQIRRLKKALEHQGHSVFVTREPGGTPLGDKIRRLLGSPEKTLKAEVFLLQASRAQHVETELRPRLQKGQIILCDRYQESSLAYQSYVRGMPYKVVDDLNRLATGGLNPDLIFVLDALSTHTRIKGRKKLYWFDKEKAGFHKKVAEAYRKLAQRLKRARKPIKIYDANLGRQELHEMILKDVQTKINRRR